MPKLPAVHDLTTEQRRELFHELCAHLIGAAEHRDAIETLAGEMPDEFEEMAGMFEDVAEQQNR